ncbi:MAG: flagellar biosynthetic protein FliO [Verrucomicrobia bacterium]|nr:flagellar biosynthetic protein FliO [Verrucomicrobiota bacterium]MBI3870320.1 flagellar biosynthetic protein FliO [Verrucomicrobiota bacterium]
MNRTKPTGRVVRVCLFLLATTGSTLADGAVASPSAGPLPDAGASLLRVAGALVFVVAFFLAGAWAFRRSQFLRMAGAKGPRLQVLDARSLGNRQSLYVVGFERQRLLIGASPAGIQMLAQLPDAEEAAAPSPVSLSFTEALQQAAAKRAP